MKGHFGPINTITFNPDGRRYTHPTTHLPPPLWAHQPHRLQYPGGRSRSPPRRPRLLSHPLRNPPPCRLHASTEISRQHSTVAEHAISVPMYGCCVTANSCVLGAVFTLSRPTQFVWTAPHHRHETTTTIAPSCAQLHQRRRGRLRARAPLRPRLLRAARRGRPVNGRVRLGAVGGGSGPRGAARRGGWLRKCYKKRKTRVEAACKAASILN